MMQSDNRHPIDALSALKVRTIKKPGRYADGNGLYLVVDPSGARRWLLRTVVQGRRRDIGLGSVRLVSLAQARELARQYRNIARSGGDPIAELRGSRRIAPMFREAANIVHAEHAAVWKNAKHAAQWLTTLEAYAYPHIGDRRVDDIDTSDVLKVLSAIWLLKPETARRLKQRLRVVLDWAKASGHRTGDNPVNGVEKGLPKRMVRVIHHRAMAYDRVSAFVQKLRESGLGEPTRLALEFLILTAARTNEVVGCRWDEIDLAGGLWIVPPSRMKAGREHRVPLTPRCNEILERAREISRDSEFVFPGRNSSKPMTNMVFLMALRRMNEGITVHGFRSAFRDWAAERTNFAREVCEMALAHTIRDKTEAAYRRGDLFDKRRALLNKWASYATAASAEVVALRKSAPVPSNDSQRLSIA